MLTVEWVEKIWRSRKSAKIYGRIVIERNEAGGRGGEKSDRRRRGEKEWATRTPASTAKKKSYTPIHQSEARDKLITINQLWTTCWLNERSRVLKKFPRRPGSNSKNYILLLKQTDRESSRPLQRHFFLGSLFRCSVPFAPHADQHY